MVDLLNASFIIFPFILAFFLLIKIKLSADHVSIMTWLLILVFAVFLFDTQLIHALLYSLAGIMDSMKITLMVGATIILVTYMELNGSLERIIIFTKTIGGSKTFQVLFICFGLGAFLVSLGATPVSMLPPVMLALGFNPVAAVALPAIGYDPLTTFALLSIPAVVFFDILSSLGVTITLSKAGLVFSLFMPVVSTGIALGMLYIAKEPIFDKENLVLAVGSGVTAGFVAIWANLFGLTVLTGVFSGLAVCLFLVLFLFIKGEKFIDTSRLTPKEQTIAQQMSLFKALSPLLLLLIFSIITNLIPPLFDLLFKELVFPLSIGSITVKTRVLWQAYTWVLVTLVVAMFYMPTSPAILKETIKKGLKRSYKPMITSALFFAVGFLLNYSAMTPTLIMQGTIPDRNMIAILSNTTADLVGPFYPLLVPFIGLFIGFVTGSETSSIATLTKYHYQTSLNLNIDPVVVNAANGIGGGLASVITPAKVQNAAAVIDEIGIEGQVIRKTFFISIVMTMAVSLLTVLFLVFDVISEHLLITSIVAYSIIVIVLGIIQFLIRFKSNK